MQAAAETARLFFALWPDDDLQAKLAAWADLATHLSANAPAVRTELARIVREATEGESAPKRAERELALALVRAAWAISPRVAPASAA